MSSPGSRRRATLRALSLAGAVACALVVGTLHGRAQSDGLPVVVVTADLAPPFDRHTGEDLVTALRTRCPPGCVLRLEEATYRDVELQFTRADAVRYSRLVIEGTSEAGSVLQPRWPASVAGCDRFSQLQFHYVPTGGLELRNFTIDGRKDEIPGGLTWAQCKTDLVLLNFANLNDRDQSGIFVHDLTLVDGASNGLQLRQVKDARVHRVTARNMGCNAYETAAKGAPTDHTCRLPALPEAVTRKGNATDSIAIMCLGGADGCEVRDSFVDGATKIGIECFHALRCHFSNNTVRHVYGTGIVAHNSQSRRDHAIEVTIEENRVEAGGFTRVATSNVGNGISVTFSVERVQVRRNEVRGNQGAGIVFDPVVWVTSAELENNTVEGNCLGLNTCSEVMVGRTFTPAMTRLTLARGNRITASARAWTAIQFAEVVDARFGEGNLVVAPKTRSGWAMGVGKRVSGLSVDGATIRAGRQGGIYFEADTTGSTVSSDTVIETTGPRCQDRNGRNSLARPPC